jgi:metallophosphoesterase (TIGR03767 family)
VNTSSEQPAASTLVRTIRVGRRVRSGRDRGYFQLSNDDGESRVIRIELYAGPITELARCTSLVHLVQFTDMQVADVQSPGRVEFLEALQGTPGGDFFVPVSRPQEALAVHGFEAVVRTINRLGASAESGRPVDLAVSTGDNIDNAQRNELDWYLAILAGALVDPNSGGADYEGVQSPNWDSPVLWHPDGIGDRYRERWGFPTCSGLLAAALTPFRATGLRMPWLSCYGNHEALVAGTAIPTAEYERILTGDRKPLGLAAGRDATRDAQLFCTHPERFLDGPGRAVASDPRRRTVSRAEYARRVYESPGAPAGHGLDSSSVRDGIAYGCYDLVDGSLPVRLIMLDTTNLDGESEAMSSGSIGANQYRWLESRLREVHAQHRDEHGALRRTANLDLPVILLSHHGLATMTTTGGPPPIGHEPDSVRSTRSALLDLLFRYPNVVLWLNGHEHVNRIVPRTDPHGRHPGFWEVTTSAVIDWPSQIRQVEMLLSPDGWIAITTTMVDSDTPLTPGSVRGIPDLASLQRELAANDPYRGVFGSSESRAAGGPQDRNTVLLRRWPGLSKKL